MPLVIEQNWIDGWSLRERFLYESGYHDDAKRHAARLHEWNECYGCTGFRGAVHCGTLEALLDEPCKQIHVRARIERRQPFQIYYGTNDGVALFARTYDCTKCVRCAFHEFPPVSALRDAS